MHIDIRNLTKTFGALRANDSISLSFAGGQIHGILGENGAGKSTLMKLLAGLLRADAGEIVLDGKPVAIIGPADSLKVGIGMVHQEPLDVPAFSALENFLCAAPRWALPTRAEARATLTIMAGRLGFSVEPDMPVASLTVGQRQQLEIIRLLACGARTLILDEPTTGITAAQARALFAALQQLAADGNTILFVSHKLHEVEELCQTVSILRTGRVVGEQMAMPIPQSHMLELMFGTETQDPRPKTQGVGASEPQNRRTAEPEELRAESREPGAEPRNRRTAEPIAEPQNRGTAEPDSDTRQADKQTSRPTPMSNLQSPILDGQLPATSEPPSTVHRPPSTVHRPSPKSPSLPTWSLDMVTLREGNLALRDLTLALQPGTVTGLAGLEGSGQLQLLRLLGGRLSPQVGRLLLKGADVSRAALSTFLKAGVHFLPADRLADGMIGAFSLSEHFALQDGRGALVDTQAAQQAARTAIERYAIKATPTTPIASLSGGNQQRAMLALLPDQCNGILLEQPTRGLDVASARSIWERLLARRDAGAAIVFASADLDEVLDRSDQVLVFFGGRISQLLPRAELSEERLAELIGGVGFVGMGHS
jgi:ABC-type uncharacterized transport system ATPase subunit